MEEKELYMKSDKFLKIESIKELKKYGLPVPQTIFIFNFKKQEKEIDDFLKNKRYVSVRSDKKGATDFCPHWLGCPVKKAKNFIRKIISKGYAVIIHELIPIYVERASGNILILKKYFIIEMMSIGPLTWMNREGKVEEWIKVRKSDFKEISHSGKRILRNKKLRNILKLTKRIPPYKLIEFTLRPEGLYFWQIKNDKTAKKLE